MFNLFEDSINYKYIQKDLGENNLSHAYLLLSNDDLNNSLFVGEVTKLILCDSKTNCGKCPSCLKVLAGSHPDILTYPKGKNFVVEDANDLIKHILEKPMLNERKIIIINNIDEGTVQAQNKILKTLEEPPGYTLFLLTAKNENKILPTITSRTRKVLLLPLPLTSIKNYILSTQDTLEENKIKQALEYGDGWIGKTIDALNKESFDSQRNLAQEIATSFSSSSSLSTFSSKVLDFKDDLKTFFELLLKEFSKSLKSETTLSLEGVVKIINEINLANQNLDRNVNPNIIVDNLLMKILEIKYYHKI